MSRALVVHELSASPEGYTDEVNSLYEEYLGRSADPAGLAYGIKLLSTQPPPNGFTPQQLLKDLLLGSSEYFITQAGQSNAQWVTTMYHAVTGSTPNVSTAASLLGELNSGMDRGSVAIQVLRSNPGYDFVVENYYQQLLKRNADAGGLAFFVGTLQNGGQELDIEQCCSVRTSSSRRCRQCSLTSLCQRLRLTHIDRRPPSHRGRRENRENGANPLRGRRCNRPGLRTDKPLRTRCEAVRGKAVRGPSRAVSQKTCLPSVLFRCFGLKHPGRQVAVRLHGRLPRAEGRSSLPCPSRQKGLFPCFTSPPASSVRVHADRIAGRHRHHRGADRPAAAGGAKSARGRSPNAVRQQSEAAGFSSPQLRIGLHEIAAGPIRGHLLTPCPLIGSASPLRTPTGPIPRLLWAAFSRPSTKTTIVWCAAPSSRIRRCSSSTAGAPAATPIIGTPMLPAMAPPELPLLVTTKKISFFPATSQTLLFTDSALLSNSGNWHLEETILVTGPIAFQNTDNSFGYFLNFTQFRHNYTANVAFLDGHVEALTEANVPTPAGWDPNVDLSREEFNLGFPFTTETPYNGQF